MAQKLWEKNVQVNAEIDRFTVGRDREMDMYLAKYDVLGSMAHITMLESIGLLTSDELKILLEELKNIYASVERGEFMIEDGIEDVHSQVELMLTRRLGDVGKKIHSGRSRNDQVLVDLKLFIRAQLKSVAEAVERLFHVLISQSNRYKDVLMPGYTHLQIAMPSSFGLWFGAYAESLVDDMMFLQAAYKTCNRNPLGSAAGYGSSFPLDREMTTRLLGFDSMNYNVVYAQMGRGKVERNVSFALASIAGTLSKMAFDACMFSCQNFGFVKLPDECTTGSSIMPHKKNPDVFELTRAKCNKIQALPQQIMMIMNNLPSGYFRDLQIIKEVFLPAFEELEDCLQVATYIMEKIKINEHILDDDKYLYMFSVEEVNRLASEGMPFRDAYKKVGLDIEAGNFSHDKTVHHTHAGSIGNLCNDKIEELMQQVVSGFNFEKVIQYLILIIFVLVGKLCAVSSGSPIFQRLQLNSTPDIKSAGSLNSHQAFVACKNKRICFPFICINRDTTSTLRHIHDQDQSMSLYKFPDHLHILHTACHVGTVVHDQHTAVRSYCCFQGFFRHYPVYRTLHYQHRMFSQLFQIIYRT